MFPRKHIYLLLIALGVLVLASLFFLWPADQASAQCGSQASSCKNCHEVQAQDPVNNDGTPWHTEHAFGDFCYLCHAGNNQSMVADEAHAGMVPPLSDVEAACQSCHYEDLNEKAQVYASALGVEVGTGGSSGDAGSESGESPPDATGPTDASAGESTGSGGAAVVVADDANVIDYNQRYEEVALGKRFINWGNVILVVLIGLVAAGGGGFVYYNERKLRGLPLFANKKQIKTSKESAVGSLRVEGYSDEVSALLPKIAQLNPVGLHALQRLLENPEEASELLHSLSRLDPDLVRQIRKLDRESRALLLALSGD